MFSDGFVILQVLSAASYKPLSAMSLPKLNPISPGDRESSVEDLRESSPLHVKQEPNTDPIDAYHTMSDSLQTVSFIFIILLATCKYFFMNP